MMIKNGLKGLIVVTISIWMLGCSPEDEPQQQMNVSDVISTTNLSGVAEIVPADLMGKWELYSMTSLNVPVNFNGDEIMDTDILAETTCFNKMYFIFGSNGDLETNQARLYFDATGKFVCNQQVYNTNYTLTGNNLEIVFEVNGVRYTETRTLSIDEEGGHSYLRISLTAEQTAAAVYVAPDPGNTVASDIDQIDFVYIKR